MDSLTALRLQIEWGVDEALEAEPVNRMLAEPVNRMMAESTIARPAPAVVQAASVPRPASRPAGAAQRAQVAAAAARTLDELRDAVAGFDGCGLSATATSLVFSDGNPESGLMLVGEAPGAEEDRTGKPFAGPSGQLLDRMLASVGLGRTQCLLTNIIPWRPPGNRNPTETEVVVCLPFVLRHIALVRPRHLVLLGGLATQAILGSKGGIMRQRGRWVEALIPGLDAPVATLPMLHPLYFLGSPASKALAWADMLSLRRALDSTAK